MNHDLAHWFSRNALRATALAATLGLAACASNSTTESAATADLADLCADFTPTALPHGAEFVSAEMESGEGKALDVCVVRGKIVSSPQTTINWAVELVDPAQWNGKSITVGGGGFDGFIPTDAYWTGEWYAHKPYVRMSSDSGHQVQSFMPWGLDHLALRNHGYLANHQTLEIGTAITADFYGRAPERRYMIGISNGGRAGLVAAERYPADYDGVVALAPAINQQAHQLGMAELMAQIYADRDNWLSPADVELFAEAEIAACDGLDGLEDGVIHNFAACDYDGSDLLCQGGKTDDCLTSGQLDTIQKVYSDHDYAFQLADGLSASYPGFGRGGAPSGDWVEYLFGKQFEKRTPFNYIASNQATKVVERDEDAETLEHDPMQHRNGWQRLSETLDPNQQDLTAFAERGGKLLVWYPVGDACVSIYRFAEYYDELKANMGEDEVADFSRFYSMPALGHVFVGPGANKVDFLDKLDSWVESGQSPDGHLAAKYREGSSEPVFERPVCEFPAFPRYDGEGDPDSAESFHCVVE